MCKWSMMAQQHAERKAATKQVIADYLGRSKATRVTGRSGITQREWDDAARGNSKIELAK